MKFTHEDIKRIAHLARLEITQEEMERYTHELSNILNFIEQMNAVDTKNVQPLAHPLDVSQPLREDRVTETDQRALFQSVAPQTEAGLYLVPQVIED